MNRLSSVNSKPGIYHPNLTLSPDEYIRARLIMYHTQVLQRWGAT